MDKPISDSMLINSYPISYDEHELLHRIVEADTSKAKIYLSGFRKRDLLIEESIRKGNLELLKLHFLLVAFIEGDELMWWYENIDAVTSETPIKDLCSTLNSVVEIHGKEKFKFIDTIINNCS